MYYLSLTDSIASLNIPDIFFKMCICLYRKHGTILGYRRSNKRPSKYFKDGSGRYPCPKCKSSYKQKTHLIRHLTFECGVEPKFVCQYCGKKFKQKSNYRTHVKFLHTPVV